MSDHVSHSLTEADDAQLRNGVKARRRDRREIFCEPYTLVGENAPSRESRPPGNRSTERPSQAVRRTGPPLRTAAVSERAPYSLTTPGSTSASTSNAVSRPFSVADLQARALRGGVSGRKSKFAISYRRKERPPGRGNLQQKYSVSI
jgi:hypothetical protein